MRKIFVLDTNVLLYDPQAMFKFADNEVVICLTVLEELDQFKKDLNENGRNARQIARYLDDLRHKGKLVSGVPINEQGILRVDLSIPERDNLPLELRNGNKADNLILGTALRLAKEKERTSVIFLTKDSNLRVRADALGLRADDYEPAKIDIEELYSGVAEIEVDKKVIDLFHIEKKTEHEIQKLTPNQFVIMKDRNDPSHSGVGRFDIHKKAIVSLIKRQGGVWGIFPKNLEQSFALDLLLNDDVKLVTLVGKAGTGKTLLALAAGLLKTIDEGRYQRLLVSRPIFPIGRDIGYLPGDIEEKLNPWMQPIFDNIEFLLTTGGPQRRGRGHREYAELVEQGMLNIEPLTYIRGRSIPNQYLIVDEAQNLTPHEIKTIITRVGEGTKVVLTGDCYQIDNPYIDSANNGLTFVVERFKDESIAGHITLTKGERSPLEELATNLL